MSVDWKKSNKPSKFPTLNQEKCRQIRTWNISGCTARQKETRQTLAVYCDIVHLLFD